MWCKIIVLLIISALVVKWISQQSSELSLGVRIPPSAQKDGHCKKSNIKDT